MSENEQDSNTADTGSHAKIEVRGKLKVGKLNNGPVFNVSDSEAAAAAAEIAKSLSPNHSDLIISETGDAEVDALVNAPEFNIQSIQEAERHVARLERHVTDAVAAGELSGAAAAEAQTAVEQAKQDVAKADKKDKGASLVKNVKRISEIFDEARKAAENTKTIGKIVLKAAPYAALAYQAISAWIATLH